MSKELIKVYDALRPRVLQLQIRWAQFRFLFTVSNKRMTVISNTAPGFFAIVRDVFRDDTFMGLARLTDKANTFSNNNLTLVALVELAESSEDHELAITARTLCDQLCEQVQNMRKWRDKWLAHTDYNQAFLEKPLPEYSVQRGQVDNAISSIIDLMNLFAYRLDRQLMSKELPIVVGDADVLARLIESMYDTQSGN